LWSCLAAWCRRPPAARMWPSGGRGELTVALNERPDPEAVSGTHDVNHLPAADPGNPWQSERPQGAAFGDQTLADANAVAQQTVSIGENIMATLGLQREALVRTRDMLHGTDSELHQGSGLIRTMMLRNRHKKLLLLMIVLMLLGIICLLIYAKLVKN